MAVMRAFSLFNISFIAFVELSRWRRSSDKGT